MGGNAFKEITRRVTREEVFGTIFWIEENWPDFKQDIRDCLLGSAGKNDESGDIDINVCSDTYDFAQTAELFTNLLGEEHVKARPGNHQIFMAVPINGTGPDRVQVDLMFGNFKWQAFSYFSTKVDENFLPRYTWNKNIQPPCSRFKGLYRTELLKAVTAFRSDWMLFDGDELIARVGPTFFHDRGLVWRYRYKPMRKDGTSRVKDFKEVSRDEFLEIFPGAVCATNDVENDPQQACKLLFNQYISSNDTMTFEQIVRLIESYRLDKASIYKIYLERLNSLNVEIPADFKDYGIKETSCVGKK